MAISRDKQESARRAAFERNVGADIRQLRQASGLSQEAVGEVLGWERGIISKIELGKRRISLHDYLVLMSFMRDVERNHPAVALAKRLLPGKLT